jgi:hypothetical protein
LAVEEAGIIEADEELAVGAVRILRSRHRGSAADVRLAAEFCGQIGLGRAAHAGAGRVAALGHEAGNDPVEDDAVVKALVHQILDPLDVAGRQVGPQPDDHVAAAVEIEDKGVQFVGHGVSPCASAADLGSKAYPCNGRLGFAAVCGAARTNIDSALARA